MVLTSRDWIKHLTAAKDLDIFVRLVAVTRGLEISCTLLHRINYLASILCAVTLTVEDPYLDEILNVCAKLPVERFICY